MSQLGCCRHAAGPRPDNCNSGDLGPNGCCRLPGCRSVFAVHDEPLDVANRYGLIEVTANTGLLTQVIADPAEYAGSGIVGPDDPQRPCDIAITHSAHVLRHVLIHRALIDAGGLNTIEQTEFAQRLGTRGVKRTLDVLSITACLFGIVTEIELRGGLNIGMGRVRLR